jgi:hypothetical protein
MCRYDTCVWSSRKDPPCTRKFAKGACEGIDNNAKAMWDKLESVHLQKKPAASERLRASPWLI